MTTIIVTAHAAERYQERFAPELSLEQCRDAIRSHGAAIQHAHAFGCHAILTGIGAKLVVHDDCGVPLVATVKFAHPGRRQSPHKTARRAKGLQI